MQNSNKDLKTENLKFKGRYTNIIDIYLYSWNNTYYKTNNRVRQNDDITRYYHNHTKSFSIIYFSITLEENYIIYNGSTLLNESLEPVRVSKWRFPSIRKYFIRDNMLLEYWHCNSLYLKAKVVIIIFSFLRKMYEKVCFVQKTKNVPNFGTEDYIVKLYKLDLFSNYRSSDL